MYCFDLLVLEVMCSKCSGLPQTPPFRRAFWRSPGIPRLSRKRLGWSLFLLERKPGVGGSFGAREGLSRKEGKEGLRYEVC